MCIVIWFVCNIEHYNFHESRNEIKWIHVILAQQWYSSKRESIVHMHIIFLSCYNVYYFRVCEPVI